MAVPPVVLGQVFIRKRVAFAGYTVLLHDFLLTLPLEVTYIWNSPWTVIKTLFLFNRYWILIGQAFVVLEETGYLSHGSEQLCAALVLYLPILAIVSGESMRFMVLMRACAILGCTRVVSVIWNILYVLYALACIGVVLFFFIYVGPPHFEYLHEIGICFSPAPPKLWTITFVILVLDSFILVMVYCSLHRMTTTGVYPSRLVRLLMRDAILFYIAALFNSLLCVVCWTVFASDPRTLFNEILSTPLLAVMGQRLVLNLRRLHAHPVSARDLSRQVDRRMAAMFDEDIEQTEQTGLQSDVDVESHQHRQHAA